MVVGYLAQIRAFEIIDISAVPFLYHLFDERVDDGVRLAGTGCAKHDCGAERIDDIYPALVPFLLKVESGRQVYGIFVVHKLRFLHEALVLVVETVVHHVVLQHTPRPYTAHHQADVARDCGDYIGVAHTGVECPPVQQE